MGEDIKAEASPLGVATAQVRDALANAEQAALSELLAGMDSERAHELLAACRAARRALLAEKTPVTDGERFLNGLEAGRRKAHSVHRATREYNDRRLRNHWRQCVAAGWTADEILDALAARYRVQRETVLRRAKRLKLFSDG